MSIHHKETLPNNFQPGQIRNFKLENYSDTKEKDQQMTMKPMKQKIKLKNHKKRIFSHHKHSIFGHQYTPQ